VARKGRYHTAWGTPRRYAKGEEGGGDERAERRTANEGSRGKAEYDSVTGGPQGDRLGEKKGVGGGTCSG